MEPHTEALAQPGVSDVADVDRAAATGSGDPAEVEHPLCDRGAERAREMVALFAPVDAVANQRAAAWQRLELDPEAAQLVHAGVSQPIVEVEAGRGQPVLVRTAGIEAAVATREQAAGQ